MKNIFKYFLLLGLVFTIGSCSTDDKVVDDVLDGVTNGAVLRTINVISSEYAIGSTDPVWSIEVEEQDNQEGALLESVDVYVSWRDESAGTTSPEVFIQNIPASAFTTDTPFGLPRTTISITLAEMLTANGIAEADIFGGDVFPVRLALNLTDGRTFTDANTAGVVTGGFFNSPFLYNANVVCAIPETFMMGDYSMIKISAGEDPFFPNYGQAFSTTTPQIVSITGTGATREFQFSYFPTGFDFGQVMTFTLSCGNILVSGTAAAGTLGCGGGSIGQSTGAVPSVYNLGDDTVIDVDFLDFEPDAGCGTGSYPVTIRLTKQ